MLDPPTVYYTVGHTRNHALYQIPLCDEIEKKLRNALTWVGLVFRFTAERACMPPSRRGFGCSLTIELAAPITRRACSCPSISNRHLAIRNRRISLETKNGDTF